MGLFTLPAARAEPGGAGGEMRISPWTIPGGAAFQCRGP